MTLGAGATNNPFAVTKADDFDDSQILQFWVQTPTTGGDATELFRPTSPMPLFLLGAKGSGKTHLMRYHSFELQTLRFQENEVAWRDGVEADGFLGVYVRCSNLNSGRFARKRQTDDLWAEVFAYYFELWLAQHLLDVCRALNLATGGEDGATFCRAVASLFDEQLTEEATDIEQLISSIEDRRRELDFAINNCVITGELNARIVASRGRLIFGIPEILHDQYPFLRAVTVLYAIDEFETLSTGQQRLINSLVRDRRLPTTFRVGARLYGVKTQETDSGEENLPDSEFERLVLDDEFRNSKVRYGKFARQLVDKRFVAATQGLGAGPRVSGALQWSRAFEEMDQRWNSAVHLDVVHRVRSAERRHFAILREKLNDADLGRVEEVIDVLSVEGYPILEKVNILSLYRVLSRRPDHLTEAKRIRSQCRDFLEGRADKSGYGSVVSHFRSDLVAQLRRENHEKQYYLGLSQFVAMSGGLPRALLTILRTIFDWSAYNGEDPLRTGRISIDAQYRGVGDASEWFFNNMRTAGRDGILIQSATDRLAQLFRTSRFADRPAECSLNSFSVAEHGMSDEAQRVLKLAESRSFLNRIHQGQKYKNSTQVQMKFQIHPMLCPRWQLPIGRRGALPLSVRLADSIFDFKKEEEFGVELAGFRRRLTFSAKTSTSVTVARSSKQRPLF